MKLLSFTEQNYKRIALFHWSIDNEGNLILISGENENGKSSVIDGIRALIEGAIAIPPKPVRKGQDKAILEGTLGTPPNQVELTIKRTISSNGNSSLIVTNKEGAKQSTPQAILDALYGNLSFDPLAFAKMLPKPRSDTIRQLLKLDFSDLEKKREELFEERTIINRTLKAKEAMLTTNRPYEGVPNDELSLDALLAEQEQATKTNAKHADIRRGIETIKAETEQKAFWANQLKGQCQELMDQITDLQKLLKTKTEEFDKATAIAAQGLEKAKMAQKEANTLQDVDLSPIKKKMFELQDTNRKVQKNKEIARISEERNTASKQADALSRQIDDIDSKRRERIANAKFPVAGMSLGDAGEVLIDGLPFEQASTKGQIMASLEMGAALNPRLRILLVKSGNDLDKNSLKLVAAWADKKEFQLWMERIEPGDMPAIVIEDGRVAEPEKKSNPQELQLSQ